MPTQSDRGHQFLADFIDLRDSMRHERLGGGGHEVCSALTTALDEAISAVMTPLPAQVAIVALGGYGRGELSPYSDVDLMILHHLDDPSDLAADLFRPLWDAKLRLGHSVRTPGEASSAARERFDTQTTLLTSRLVVGDRQLFNQLMAEVATVTKARPLRRHLVAAERQRRLESPYLLMAANVKTGRGGLRTLQGFEWERRREALIGRFSADSRPEENKAREHLIEIRNSLHAVTGRPQDEFAPEIRQAAARWLGIDAFEAGQRLVTSLQAVDRLATNRWPEVGEAEQPARRRVWSRKTTGSGPIRVDHEPSLEELLRMLETGEEGRITFERLWDDGLLDGVLPEWGVVRSLPQLAPFHEHPVDAHLWRTVAEMQELLSGGDEYRQTADELDRTDVALLAAFLHDIGKGHGGDHARVGGDIARRFCGRVGVPDDRAGLLEVAVRHHLLLAETATRRDLDDPAVIEEVAEELGSTRQTRLVYLLTVADSRATGPTMWTDWKATLLRTLYARVMARFGSETSEIEPGTTRELVVGAVALGRRPSMMAHLEAMPEDYLRSTPTEDVVWHLDVILGRHGLSALGVRGRAPVETALVVGDDDPGFRLRVAESFAANGVDVLEARMHTRADGLIVDSFQVRDDRTGQEVSERRWQSTRANIEAALLGKLDMRSKVEARARAYESAGEPSARPRIECGFDSASGDLVVVVKCSDRVGRLAEILTALSDSGLEIRLAKLDSRADELVDTFYVRRGVEPVGADDLRSLERLIAAGISL